jgi:4-amino-4-deoxy-L-arabinose transferase-like glycosyltransferase
VLAILTRPAIEFLAPLLVVYFALAVHRLSLRATLRHVAVYGLIYTALMLPWWAHNEAKYGQIVRLNLASGFLLYAGNNPMNQSGGGIVGVDWDDRYRQVSDRVAQDRAYRDEAVAYIKQNPRRTLELAWLKFLRFWRIWPYTPQFTASFYIILSLVSYLPVLALALIYLVIWGRAHVVRILPILAFAGCLTAIHMLLVSSIRYRLPIEPFMIMFASFAFVRLLERLQILRTTSRPNEM